jgi:hypothetical protein
MFQVLANTQIAPNIHRIEISSPRIASIRQPGQFVIVRVAEGDERIPLTIVDADVAGPLGCHTDIKPYGKVSIRYKLPYLKTMTEHSMATIEPGGTFGWSSLSAPARYRFSAYCLGENCKSLRCSREKLVSVLERNHTIGYKVMKNLALVVSARFVSLQNEIARRDGQDFMDGW